MIRRDSFARGLVIETSGVRDQILKLLPPPPTVTEAELD